VEPDLTAVLELSWNKWDDYDYKTSLFVKIQGQHGTKQLDEIKILIEDQKFTANYFEKLIQDGWDGIFPLPSGSYISNPTELSFYEELASIVGIEVALSAAEKLHDASLLTRVRDDEDALRLVAIPAFNFSLLRERGSQRAFNERWKLFVGKVSSVEDVRFAFLDRDRSIQTVRFEFGSDSLFPHDISLLIGPNGVGKSQLLHQFVEHWLQAGGPNNTGFETQPSFGRLIAVSYSPFERLRVDTDGLVLADRAVYQYFGLRGRGPNGPTLSLNHARQAAVQSLINCARDDRRFSGIKAWSEKLGTLQQVLGEAIHFDFAALEIPSTIASEVLQVTAQALQSSVVQVASEAGDRQVARQFVRIDQDTAGSLNLDAIEQYANVESGVVLFLDGQILEMSSGQRLFSYVVINLLGSIRRNSLVIIDEPELFLHPTLELALVTMLKSILESYNSKAIIATHSLVLVREVPRDCVHVFSHTDNGLLINYPPFQTFGGDIQRISSYVFGDNSVSKPFERWIELNAKEAGGRRQLLKRLAAEDLNEELLIELGDEEGSYDPAT